MSSIPAIKATEVNNQVANILNAFSSVNFKINVNGPGQYFSMIFSVNGSIHVISFIISYCRTKLEPFKIPIKIYIVDQSFESWRFKKMWMQNSSRTSTARLIALNLD